MAFPLNQIITVNTRISSAGLSTADFGSAMLFVPASDAITERAEALTNSYKTYYSIQSVAEDFPETSETYKLASIWFGSAPVMPSLMIWVMDAEDESLTATLNKARNLVWWYWTFVTKPTLEQPNDVKEIAKWCDDNSSYFVNSQTGTSCTAIRTEATENDIASELTTLGYRHVTTVAHASEAYAGVYLAKHFGIINFNSQNSTITGEYKKSSGLASEDLADNEYAAMIKDTKKCAFYTTIELQGSTDSGRWKNTRSHSSYGEWMDDVVNLDAFVNHLNVEAYNTIAKQPTKLPQMPVGQSLLINSVKSVCERFIKNGYLGKRTYIDPLTAEEKTSRGYEILSKPEDILNLTDTERNERYAAPISVMIFRAGAIQAVKITVDVY